MRKALVLVGSIVIMPVAAAMAILQPGGSGTLAHVVLPDGSEYLVTQTCNWSTEPYTVDFFMRDPGGEWGWCYVDHEAFRWRDVALVHDEATDTLTLTEGGMPRAHLDRREGRFWLEQRGAGSAAIAPQELRSPGS